MHQRLQPFLDGVVLYLRKFWFLIFVPSVTAISHWLFEDAVTDQVKRLARAMHIPELVVHIFGLFVKYPVRSSAVATLIVFSAAVILTLVKQPSALTQAQPPKAKSTEAQPTMLSLMDTGFPNLNKLWGSPVIHFGDGASLPIKSALYFDLFTSGAKFLGFYIPSSARVLEACAVLANHAVELGDSLSNSGLALTCKKPGENPQTLSDLRYSGKVYLYHEDALTHKQMADVEEVFRHKQLTVILRGPDFLTQAWLAWKQKTL